MFEFDFIERLRAIAIHPGARGLLDDVAVLEVGGETLVLTHDTLVEGVHFLPSDPPADVAWKLVAVNLSDLAAKGATPVAAMMSYTLTGNADWDGAFADGLATALAAFELPLLGGDTVSFRERVLGMTLLGSVSGSAPSRSGARAGDALFVTGTIGDAGVGLASARNCDGPLIDSYRRPQPQLDAGYVLAPIVTAMMDISDGLLIDASRLAAASGCAAEIQLDTVPLSRGFIALQGEDRAARLFAATAGDDYQLLFTAALPLPQLPVPATRIGRMVSGAGLHLSDRSGAVPLPERLGWEHR